MKYALPIAALALLVPAGVIAQTSDTQSTGAAATDATPTESPATDTPDAAPPMGDATPSLDTPIAALIADPKTKAVLDKDLPGMSSDANLDKFKDKSLRQLQPLTGGQLSDALLKKTGHDLAAIGSAKPKK